MPDGWRPGQVDMCDLVRAEEDAELAVLVFGTNSDMFASKGAGHLPQSAFETDVIFRRWHDPHDFALVVDGLGRFVGHRPDAGAVAVGGRLVVDALVRALEIVNVSPAIEG